MPNGADTEKANGNAGKKNDSVGMTESDTARGFGRGSLDFIKSPPGLVCVLLALLLGQGFRNSVAITANGKAIADLTRYIDKQYYGVSLRLARIENKVGLETPFREGSHIRLIDLGDKILRESGMDDLLAKYKSKLMEKVKAENLPASPSISKVEGIAKQVIDNYPDFDKADAKTIEDYMSKRPELNMYNIWELAGIRFRDILMDKYDIHFSDEPQEKEEAPTEEKTTSPP